jgi:hypothetical protein
MPSSWRAVCQWCGKTGISLRTSTDSPPGNTPQVAGKCPSHPSGRKDANHGPKWEKA